MNIISLEFAVLSVASIIMFYLLPGRFRVLFLTALSCAFIALMSYPGLIYVSFYAIVNYFLGLRIAESQNRLVPYRVGIIFNLLQLVLLRYSSFAIDPAFKVLGSTLQASLLSEIIIPIGISYFTLQGIGYLINVKMGWEKPERNFMDFFLYIVFYPKFLSGPIERSNHFLPQLKKRGLFDDSKVSLGLRIALFGFFKKIAIANQLAPFVTETYSNLSLADGSSLWLVLILQPVYLYFDFSGYTDIAIGFAKAFGIELLPNFNRPFFSENVTTFWKRFHMSLSLWFNDYIFRQTSFRRRKWGIFASTYAVFVTFTLFGIWHGAGWNFMILGLLQALAINYEFFTRKIRLRLFSLTGDFFRVWAGRTATFLFYAVSLVFFFSPDIESTGLFFSKLFTYDRSILDIIIQKIPFSSIAFIIILFFTEYIQNDGKLMKEKLDLLWSGEGRKQVIIRWLIYAFTLTAILVLGNKAQQFIYTQF